MQTLSFILWDQDSSQRTLYLFNLFSQYRADDFLSGAARDGPALNGYRPQLSPSSATVSRTFRSTTSTSRELPPSSASLSFRRASVSGPPSARQQTTTITSNTSGANRSPYLLVYDTNDVNKQTKRTPIEHFDVTI